MVTPNFLPQSRAFEERVQALGLELPAALAPGANYELAVLHAGVVHLSGQLPRVGDAIAVTGAVGAQTTLEEAQRAARICALRALAALRHTLGSLDRVERMLRLGVFVHSSPDFTRQSEVADGASNLLYEIFGSFGGHARTSVGVAQLPKNAAVEIELSVAVTV